MVYTDYAHVGLSSRAKAGFMFEPRLLAFVVRPRDVPVRVVDLGPAGRIDALLKRWRERYVDRSRQPDAREAEPGTELYTRCRARLDGI